MAWFPVECDMLATVIPSRPAQIRCADNDDSAHTLDDMKATPWMGLLYTGHGMSPSALASAASCSSCPMSIVMRGAGAGAAAGVGSAGAGLTAAGATAWWSAGEDELKGSRLQGQGTEWASPVPDLGTLLLSVEVGGCKDSSLPWGCMREGCVGGTEAEVGLCDASVV